MLDERHCILMLYLIKERGGNDQCLSDQCNLAMQLRPQILRYMVYVKFILTGLTFKVVILLHRH